MASLKNHKKEEMLYNVDGIILYSPSVEQEAKLMDLIENSSSLKDGKIDIVAGMDIIRYILKELSNIENEEIDSMTDRELDETLSTGDSAIEGLVEAVVKIIEKIGNKIANSIVSQVIELDNMVSLAKGIKSLEDVEKKYKDLAKVNKNLPPFEEFIEKSLISQENNNK